MKPDILRADEKNEYFFEEGCFILELSNTADDPGLSIARARVAPGMKTRLHRLKEVVERYVVLAGTGRVEIGELPPANVAHGDVVLIPPDCPQKITNIGKTDLIFLVMCTPRFTTDAYLDMEPAGKNSTFVKTRTNSEKTHENNMPRRQPHRG